MYDMNILYFVTFEAAGVNVRTFAAGPDLDSVTEYFEEKYPDLKAFSAQYATEEQAKEPQPLVYVGDREDGLFTFEGLEARALEILEENDSVFSDLIEELDSYNGFADGNRVEDMDWLDYRYGGMKLSEFLDIITSDFSPNDNYFVHTIYGLESTDDREEYYRENFTASEVYNAALSNLSHVNIDDSELEEILEKIDYINGEL